MITAPGYIKFNYENNLYVGKVTESWDFGIPKGSPGIRVKFIRTIGNGRRRSTFWKFHYPSGNGEIFLEEATENEYLATTIINS